MARCWNWLFRDSRTVSSATAPLGISFLSFSAISYLIDIYREKARAGSFIDCLLYLSFFPKVISGPIVLWKEFETEITGRRTELEDAVCGFNRIMAGFIKKLILADQFGLCVSRIPLYEVDIISAWGVLCCICFRFTMTFLRIRILPLDYQDCSAFISGRILIFPTVPDPYPNFGDAGIFLWEHGSGNMYISRWAGAEKGGDAH